jgi:hypothetical protein
MPSSPADKSAQTTAGGYPSVPTTKVLALGYLDASITPEQRQTIMPHEVPDTLRIYLAGKIDQWWSRQDGPGAVFLMNVTTVAEARELLENLPLVKAKLLTFELVPLGPLRPLHQLLPVSPSK